MLSITSPAHGIADFQMPIADLFDMPQCCLLLPLEEFID